MLPNGRANPVVRLRDLSSDGSLRAAQAGSVAYAKISLAPDAMISTPLSE